MYPILSRIIITLLFANSVYAQVPDTVAWCPPGATWTYEREAVFGEIYLQLAYEKDTIINGIATKKINTREIEYFSDPNDPLNNYSRSEYPIGGAEFYYQSNDSIYWYHNGGFQFLYDFGANVGEEWRVDDGETYRCPTPVGGDTFVVDSVSMKTYDGRQFDIIHGSMTGNNWRIGDLIVKNIGSTNSPFPQPGSNCTILHGISGSLGSLNCYYDDIRSFVNFGSRRDCMEMITAIDKIPNSSLAGNQSNWKIYPNPASNTVQVEWRNEEQTTLLSNIECTLYNISGQKVYQKTTGSVISINIDPFDQGVYILVLSTEKKGIFYREKIIKLDK